MPQDEVRNEFPERYGIETGIVVVTDPPYGQHESGVPGDDSADHRAVYKLLKPHGGFSFCAYRPPLFREAEEGIEAAKGKPIHYLAMRTKSAHGQGPGNRLRNVLQAIIYWERKGADLKRGLGTITASIWGGEEGSKPQRGGKTMAKVTSDYWKAHGKKHPKQKPQRAQQQASVAVVPHRFHTRRA